MFSWLTAERLPGDWTCLPVNAVDRRLLRISKKETRFISILQAMCLESVWRAVEDAGLRVEDLHRSRTGVFVGAYELLGNHTEAPDETNIRCGGGRVRRNGERKGAVGLTTPSHVRRACVRPCRRRCVGWGCMICVNGRGVLMSSLADRIGYFLGTHGPSLTIDTACRYVCHRTPPPSQGALLARLSSDRSSSAQGGRC